MGAKGKTSAVSPVVGGDGLRVSVRPNPHEPRSSDLSPRGGSGKRVRAATLTQRPAGWQQRRQVLEAYATGVARQDVGEVLLWIDASKPAGAENRVGDRGTVTARVGPRANKKFLRVSGRHAGMRHSGHARLAPARGADPDDRALLQRLAGALDGGARELGDLVEEQRFGGLPSAPREPFRQGPRFWRPTPNRLRSRGSVRVHTAPRRGSGKRGRLPRQQLGAVTAWAAK